MTSGIRTDNGAPFAGTGLTRPVEALARMDEDGDHSRTHSAWASSAERSSRTNASDPQDSAINAGFGSAGERCMAISVLVAVGDVADTIVPRITWRNLKSATLSWTGATCRLTERRMASGLDQP
jgi:hypothetical protein